MKVRGGVWGGDRFGIGPLHGPRRIFIFVVKPMENHTFWHQQGSPNRPSFGAAGQVLWALSGRVLRGFSGSSLGLLWGALL